MSYYQSNVTGKIVGENAMKAIADVYGLEPKHLLMAKTVEEVPNPSVIDCLQKGNRALAIVRYCEIHGCGFEEAKKVVNAILRDMKIQKKKREKELARGAKVSV